MLKLRTAGSAPSASANAKAIRAPIPATSRMPASRPTRASATPSPPSADAGGEPHRIPRVRPTAASVPTRTRSLPAVGSECDVLAGDEEDDREGDEDAAAVELPLAGLAQDEEDERGVEEVLGCGHAAIIGARRRRVVGARVEPRVDLGLHPWVDPVKDA